MQHDYEAEMKTRNVQQHAQQLGKHATMETYHVEQNLTDEGRGIHSPQNPPSLFSRIKQSLMKLIGR